MAAVDSAYAGSLSSFSLPVWGPANNAASVTPDDATDLSNVTTGLFVGGAGNIVVVMRGGQTVTLNGVLAGAVLPIRVSRVKSTLTTATNIVALW